MNKNRSNKSKELEKKEENKTEETNNNKILEKFSNNNNNSKEDSSPNKVNTSQSKENKSECTDDKVISSDQESIKPKYNLELLWHIVRSFAGSGVEKYAKEVWLALGRDPIKVDKKNRNKKVYSEALKK